MSNNNVVLNNHGTSHPSNSNTGSHNNGSMRRAASHEDMNDDPQSQSQSQLHSQSQSQGGGSSGRPQLLKQGSISSSSLKEPLMVGASFDLASQLYKRKGGLGRNPWTLRCFTLYGSVICYYDTSDMKACDPSRPRNRIDLSREDTLVEMENLKRQGSPTEYMLVIHLFMPVGGRRKWELCCLDGEQQQQWYNALKSYDGKPRGFVSQGGRASPSPLFASNEVTSTSMSVPIARGGVSHGRTRSSVDSEPPVVVPSARHKAARRMQVLTVPFVIVSSWEDLDRYVVISFFILTTLTLVMRYGSMLSFVISIALAGATVSYLCAHVSLVKLQQQHQQQQQQQPVSAMAHHDASMDEEDDETDEDRPKLEAGSSLTRALTDVTPPSDKSMNDPWASAGAARAWAEACRVESPFEPSSLSSSSSHNQYWTVDPSLIKLRTGPDYSKHKLKAPGGPPLYDLMGLDLVPYPTCATSVTDIFTVPPLPADVPRDTGHPHVPPRIIFTINIPSEEPSLLSGAVCSAGPSFVAIVYLVLSADTRQQLKDMDNATPAVKLFAQWCANSHQDESLKHRLKALAVVEDIEKLGLPGFIAGYNGKPALITKSGTLRPPTPQRDYLEVVVNVHMWAFIPKKCLYQLQPRFPSMVINFGFTIEGRSNNELPECLIGAVKVLRLQLDQLVKPTT